MSEKALTPKKERFVDECLTGLNAEEEEVETPAGSLVAYRVSVQSDWGEDRFWFEKAFPHRMLKRQTAARDLFELRATKKLAYWELNRPGDEAHLP